MRLRRLIGFVVAVVAALWAVIGDPSARALGDRIQVALPLIGAACAATRLEFGDYALRFAGTMVVVHGTKHALGDAAVNLRPNGSGQGFPSGHTAAAVYGASYLIRTCGANVPYAGPALALAAGVVGGSRLYTRRHDLLQVVAGAVIGLVFDLGLRSDRSRQAARRHLVQGWVLLGHALRAVRRQTHASWAHLRRRRRPVPGAGPVNPA